MRTYKGNPFGYKRAPRPIRPKKGLEELYSVPFDSKKAILLGDFNGN